jgi:hypothetical protein
MAYIKKQCNSIAKKVADGKAPPRKAPDDGVGGWLRPKEVGLSKHVDPVYGVQHQANFEAAMEPSRQLHKEGYLAKDAVGAAAVLMEQVEQPAAEKAMEAEKEPKRVRKEEEKKERERERERVKEEKRERQRERQREMEARNATKRAKKANKTGYCKHGRKKNSWRECGTGYCEHDRKKADCRDCGTGQCAHGRRKRSCGDCGTGQ